MKENYRECPCYKDALQAIRENKGGFVRLNFRNPGYEIPLARKRKWKYMDPCTTALFLTEADGDWPCLECPMRGGFVTAPKVTPYMIDTVGLGNSLYANTCHEFGLGTNQIITSGQVWALTDNINRIVQAAAMIAAVSETGGGEVLLITDRSDYEEWIRQIECFAELFGRVRFVKDVDLDEKEPDGELRVVLADMSRLAQMKERLCRDWDLMIVDHARVFVNPDLNEHAFQIGKHAFFRLIIASGRRGDSPRDWFWIYRLADERIFGSDYDAYIREHFDRPGYPADTIHEELWIKLSSIGMFVDVLDKGDPFYRWNTIMGKEIRKGKEA